jgi:hypothetical protein
MEADWDTSVYRVSHVVDGEFASLLRRNHSNRYHVAAESPDLPNFTPNLAAESLNWSFFVKSGLWTSAAANKSNQSSKIRRL